MTQEAAARQNLRDRPGDTANAFGRKPDIHTQLIENMSESIQFRILLNY
jgi:hypothetical protein